MQSDLQTLEQASAAFENAPADKPVGALYIACQAVATVVGRAGYRGQHITAQRNPYDRRLWAASQQNPSTRPHQAPLQNALQPDRTVEETQYLHDRLIQPEKQLRERQAKNAALQQQLELRERGAIQQAQRPPRPQWTQQELHGVRVAYGPPAGDIAPSMSPGMVSGPSPPAVEMELDGSLAISTTPAHEAISPDGVPRRTPDPPCPSWLEQKSGGASSPSEPRGTAIVPQQGDDVGTTGRYSADHEDAPDSPRADCHPNNSAEPDSNMT
ncbi:hypothetical protein BDV59DRAFT_189975, partial [Aspergillus ambiguus]|uniref:uncharacterized protein n=1 Tax=Aspergillus ambiguus TaxID=176160 RepID=UPI003CCE3AF2